MGTGETYSQLDPPLGLLLGSIFRGFCGGLFVSEFLCSFFFIVLGFLSVMFCPSIFSSFNFDWFPIVSEVHAALEFLSAMLNLELFAGMTN